MTNTELKAAMLDKVPVIHRDKRHGTTHTYDRIDAIRYQTGDNGKIVVSAELLNEKANCVVRADAEEVEKV